MKTREKIILASLDLFNEQGERNVTTNHIASHLSISPGNLYYHFRNKSDIIYEIFLQYELLVDHYLQLPEGREINLDDMVFYLESVFDGLWSYRFLHRDLEFLMDCDPRLRSDYKAFTDRCLEAIQNIFKSLERAGIMVASDPKAIDALALNVWLIVTNWMMFLKTVFGDNGAQLINKDLLKQGIYQVITAVLPYAVEGHRNEVLSILSRYEPIQLITASLHERKAAQ